MILHYLQGFNNIYNTSCIVFNNVSILQNMILDSTIVFFSIYFPHVFCFVDNLRLKMIKGSSVVKTQNFQCGGVWI